MPNVKSAEKRIENKTEEAYWRGDLFEKRAKLMRAWGAYCSRPEGPQA